MIRDRFQHLALLLVFSVSPAAAADGTLKVKFKYDGTPPKPAALAGVPAGICGPKAVVDESLVVGPKGELQNVVLWMYTTKDKPAPNNPAALAALAKEVSLDNKACRYQPRVALMHTSQTLVIGNPDPIGHNSKGDLFANRSFNELIPSGGKATFKFDKTERRPMPVACSIHPWMSGWLLIQDHPYFGVSDAQGVLTIPHIPEGDYTFVAWHEKPGFLQKVKQGAKEIEWKRGQLAVTIKGETDLGEFLWK